MARRFKIVVMGKSCEACLQHQSLPVLDRGKPASLRKYNMTEIMLQRVKNGFVRREAFLKFGRGRFNQIRVNMC